MRYKIDTNIEKVNRKLWEEFSNAHPNSNFFQSPDYYDFYGSMDSLFEPVGIFAEDSNGQIAGVLIAVILKEKGYLTGIVSKRCIVYGGPIVRDNDNELVDLLVKALIKKVKSKSIYIEFRNLFELSGCKNHFENNGFEYLEHLNFILEVSDVEENLAKLHNSRRRQIKKGINSGSEITEAKDINEVREFYNLLKKLYKEKVRKPLPDFSLFENFFRNPKLGKIFLVQYEGKIIGGAMCPIFKDTIYEFYLSGLDKEYKEIYPSVLATWAPIEFAANKQMKYFDFLGAGPADKESGVRDFKSKFGGELVNYGRFIRVNNPFLYTIGKMGLRFYNMFLQV